VTDSARGRIVAALFALAFALSFALTRAVPFNSRTFLFDYHAFACAGAIAGTRDDPYRTEPLRSCEHRRIAFRRDQAKLAVPAPLPGYALAPFAILGRLPNPLGALLWLGLSLIGALVAGLALARISRLPKTTVWAALTLPLLATAVLGQLVAVALGALCLSALALERGKYALAGVLAWVAMIEPHVALPACIALAIFVPRTRPALGAGAIVAALLSLVLLGAGLNVEYLTTVLGAHASSELTNEEQYSLAYYLHAMGASDRLAQILADAWYVCVLVLGMLAAHRFVQRGAPRALYALLPAALAAIGAPFVHIGQIAFALPAALVLCGRVAPGARALRLAIVTLAIPWGAFGTLLACVPLVAVAFGTLAADLFRARPIVATVAGLAAAAFMLELALHLTPRPDATAALAAFGNGHLLAEASWTAYIRNGFHSNIALFSWAKLPTYLGLGLLLGLTARVALGPPIPARTPR
jgi:hypothetical protein